MDETKRKIIMQGQGRNNKKRMQGQGEKKGYEDMEWKRRRRKRKRETSKGCGGENTLRKRQRRLWGNGTNPHSLKDKRLFLSRSLASG